MLFFFQHKKMVKNKVRRFLQNASGSCIPLKFLLLSCTLLKWLQVLEHQMYVGFPWVQEGGRKKSCSWIQPSETMAQMTLELYRVWLCMMKPAHKSPLVEQKLSLDPSALPTWPSWNEHAASREKIVELANKNMFFFWWTLPDFITEALASWTYQKSRRIFVLTSGSFEPWIPQVQLMQLVPGLSVWKENPRLKRVQS